MVRGGGSGPTQDALRVPAYVGGTGLVPPVGIPPLAEGGAVALAGPLAGRAGLTRSSKLVAFGTPGLRGVDHGSDPLLLAGVETGVFGGDGGDGRVKLPSTSWATTRIRAKHSSQIASPSTTSRVVLNPPRARFMSDVRIIVSPPVQHQLRILGTHESEDRVIHLLQGDDVGGLGVEPALQSSQQLPIVQPAEPMHCCLPDHAGSALQ